MNLVYITPKKEELYYRKKLVEDKLTMKYNNGIVLFPKEKWDSWFNKWIGNNDPNYYYAYIYDKDIKAYVGEIAYRKELNIGSVTLSIIIENKYRKKGYGKEALKALVSTAFNNGKKEVRDLIGKNNIVAQKLFSSFGFKVVGYDKDGNVDFRVTKEEYNKIIKNEKDFNTLLKNLNKCEICKEKFGFKPHPVLLGNINSKIVQISQAPSATVHKTLKPFTDQSGKKLKYEWYMISDDVFYNPNNFYITSLAHCYPGKDKNGNDRTPSKICYETWVKKELEYVNNKLYIIIGAKSAKVFFPNKNFNDLIFEDNYINGKLAIVLPHPSPLNIKWFKDHPQFMEKRIFEIRKIINDVLEDR